MIDEKYDIAISQITNGLTALGYEELKVIRVAGTSMEPTLRDGSFVWYVPCGKTLIDGAMYVLNMGGYGQWVKRIVRHGDGIVARSDNKECGFISIPDNTFETVVLGRVVWALHKF